MTGNCRTPINVWRHSRSWWQSRSYSVMRDCRSWRPNLTHIQHNGRCQMMTTIKCSRSSSMSRYDISLFDVFNGTFAKLFYAYEQRLYNTAALASAEFLIETINLRDGLLVLPDNGLTFNDIIDFICSNSYICVLRVRNHKKIKIIVFSVVYLYITVGDERPSGQARTLENGRRQAIIFNSCIYQL